MAGFNLTKSARADPDSVMAATIGEQLRLAREQRGIALREVSNETHISIRYLEAIESNDYKNLPGGIFNRSFVKAYARSVGIDEKEAVEAYTRYMREQSESGEEVETKPYHSKVYTDAPATRSPILTVILAIVILAILTIGALAAIHWFQRRSANVDQPLQPSIKVIAKTGVPGNSRYQATEFVFWQTNYEEVSQ
jgi:cytoskeletal protein RodZ